VTALIPHINIKQFVLSIPVTQAYDSDASAWLEAGGVSLGPLNIDAAMTLPCTAYLTAQQHFLRLHDRRTKRLTFLWATTTPNVAPDPSVPTSVEGVDTGVAMAHRCGCIGGCRFFGENRNGASFFTPSDRDFIDSMNTAVQLVCTDGRNYGYGQSVMQPQQLVLNLDTVPLSHAQTMSMVIRRRYVPPVSTPDRTFDDSNNVTADSNSVTLIADRPTRESSVSPRIGGDQRFSGRLDRVDEYSRCGVLAQRSQEMDRPVGVVVATVRGSKLSAVSEQDGESLPSGEDGGSESWRGEMGTGDLSSPSEGFSTTGIWSPTALASVVGSTNSLSELTTGPVSEKQARIKYTYILCLFIFNIKFCKVVFLVKIQC